MRILFAFRADYHNWEPVPAYPWSFVRELEALGHTVYTTAMAGLPDFILEIENGRDEQGELHFRFTDGSYPDIPKAVLLIDSHGHPDLHQLVAKSYDHVFFAVWSRRDLFAGHPSAHWCPNATDLEWFDTTKYRSEPHIGVGFFGSKMGLSRADDLVAVCRKQGWSYDVRQVAGNRNVNRWPATAEAMARCKVLFNRGQKHDGPNLRVMESMAMFRPLLSDFDSGSGMSKLFDPYVDYWPYSKPADIEPGLRMMLGDPGQAYKMASAAYAKVTSAHLVKHRVAQIMEVIGG